MHAEVGGKLQFDGGASYLDASVRSHKLGGELGGHSTQLQVLGGQPVIAVHLQVKVMAAAVCLGLLGGLGMV